MGLSSGRSRCRYRPKFRLSKWTIRRRSTAKPPKGLSLGISGASPALTGRTEDGSRNCGSRRWQTYREDVSDVPWNSGRRKSAVRRTDPATSADSDRDLALSATCLLARLAKVLGEYSRFSQIDLRVVVQDKPASPAPDRQRLGKHPSKIERLERCLIPYPSNRFVERLHLPRPSRH